MIGLAVAMDAVATISLCWALAGVLRPALVPGGGDGGRSVAVALIGVSLILLSVPLWSLP
ncbi:hypothetical protein [Actinomadura violacea]|uniref:Uncharacterized protein n=1 Tax=Actinomadura violacea TaxID=2819934 RepID=A0ABS3RRQ3_9ACTN|nr:hypothetical protein [Actinomadura violacea]MBO2459332.1 hypothetical protein [Actinomadura violacea]